MIEKRNIFLVGPMGAGKSTIGRKLAQQLNMLFFDSDQEIERRTGVNISWVFDIEGEEGFRHREKKVITELTEKHGIVLATGGGSVKMREVRNHLSSRGLVIYLKTTIDRQLARTSRRDKSRPLLNITTSPREILKKLSYERDHFYEEIADVIILNDGETIRSIVYKIIYFLKKIDFFYKKCF